MSELGQLASTAGAEVVGTVPQNLEKPSITYIGKGKLEELKGKAHQGGGPARDLCDIAIVVPHATTSDRIQELHIKALHIVIEAVERRLFPDLY